MKTPLIRTSVLLLLGVSCLVIVSIALARSTSVFDQLNLVMDVRHEIVRNYVEDVDQEELIEHAVRAMVQSLDDRYSTYLKPEDLEPMDNMVQDRFTGIGAEITIDDATDRLQIVTPLEDSPAWRAGIMPADVILEIDGVATAELFADLDRAKKLRVAISRLKGEAGTPVLIEVRHESGEQEHITVVRELINVKGVRGFRRDADNRWSYMLSTVSGIGYIKIRQFTDRTADELRAALDLVTQQQAQGLILDLRFNPGGLLTAAVAVAETFLDAGHTVVSVKGRNVSAKVERSERDDVINGIPLVVLANETSASAAEIVTGALTDNGRAKFVGMRTWGKGSVQQIREIESGGALKITTAYYYLPSGRLIHRRDDSDIWGVDPEDGFFVPMSYREMYQIYLENKVLRPENIVTVTPEWIEENLSDLQLAAAMRTLLGKLATGQWPKVGESGAELLARESKRKNLVAQRDLLHDRLDKVEQELTKLDADSPSASAEPAPEPDP